MCGIVGLILPRRAPFAGVEARSIVEAMTGALAHRGPDDAGVWADRHSRCVLGHRRLSVIDTSEAGHQPFASNDGRWVITFNGEIYNFKDLRPRLSSAVRPRSRTDTEVLVEALASWGVDAIRRLDGMFAFAAFDTITGETLLARDPFGEKPLYYMGLGDKAIAFASELQALELVPGFRGELDLDSMAEVLCFQYIGAPRTIYSSVRKLPPGHWMRINANGDVRVERYFTFEPGRDPFAGRSSDDLVDEVEDILLRSLQRRLIADVPLGAFLSGGVDSSTVCALVRRRLDRPLTTFSVGFRGHPDSEHHAAQAYAEILGTEHRTLLLDPQRGGILPRLGALLDEPNGDSSCLPTLLLSEFAHQEVKVALSGDGGDELFGGYTRYGATIDTSKSEARVCPGDVYYGHQLLVANEAQISELFGFVPTAFANRLRMLRSDLNCAQPTLIAAMRRHDVEQYLPGAVLAKVDRMSMRHALEVRTPYLSVELARFAERIPDELLLDGSRSKVLLRELAYRHLPRHLVDLPKQGFGVPQSEWTTASLRQLGAELVESEDSRLSALFGRARVSDFVSNGRNSGSVSVYFFWSILILESWLRSRITQQPVDLETRVATYAARAQADMGAVQLRAEPVSVGVFVLAGEAGESAKPRMRRLSDRLMDRLIDLASTSPSDQASDVALPGWTEPLSDADMHRLAVLRSATVAFEAPEAQLIDQRVIDRLCELGVARVLVDNPHAPEDFEDWRLNRQTGIRRGTGLASLWRDRVVCFSARPMMKMLFRSRQFMRRSHSTFEADLSEFLDASDAPRLMLFEGTRQLPPMSTRITESSPAGRYAVEGTTLILSATEDAVSSKTFWAVLLDKNTRPHLEVVPTDGFPLFDAAEPSEELAAFFRPDDGADLRLEAGDPLVVCTHGLTPGGAERQWIYLAEALRDAGFDVTFLTFMPLHDRHTGYLPLLEQSGIPLFDATWVDDVDVVRDLPSQPGLGRVIAEGGAWEKCNLARVMSALTRLKPKAVFAQLDDANLFCALGGRLCGVPRIVMSFRNYNPSRFDWMDQAWYLPAYRLAVGSGAVRLTGNSPDAIADYAAWIGLSPESVHLIPNVIDSRVFTPASPEDAASLRSSLDLEADAPVVLGVFRLFPEKDPLTFLEVARRLIARNPRLRVLLAGDGPMRDAIEERIGRDAIGTQVTLLGDRRDVRTLMTIADVVLHTSIREGMSNVAMEAQLMAKPLVAVDVPGVANVVKPGDSAVLCPAGDAAALADACSALLRDRGRARAMGVTGREHALRTFANEGLAERYLSIL